MYCGFMPDPLMLGFDEFWHWLQGHINCIISAGTPDAVLYDHDDFHWNLGREVTPEGPEELLVQLVRGKQMVGEVLIPHARMTHVQVLAQGEDGEFLFECYEESDEGPLASYYFTLSHGYEILDETEPRGRWVH